MCDKYVDATDFPAKCAFQVPGTTTQPTEKPRHALFYTLHLHPRESCGAAREHPQAPSARRLVSPPNRQSPSNRLIFSDPRCLNFAACMNGESPGSMRRCLVSCASWDETKRNDAGGASCPTPIMRFVMTRGAEIILLWFVRRSCFFEGVTVFI